MTKHVCTAPAGYAAIDVGERKPSILPALHRRYEEAMAEHDTACDAQHAAENPQSYNLLNAMSASCSEMDVLRLAILRQVPATWADAMILQYHIAEAYDARHFSPARAPDDHEIEALQTAISTMFDFLCCAISDDHERFGDAFQREAVRAFYQRRYRTGVVGD